MVVRIPWFGDNVSCVFVTACPLPAKQAKANKIGPVTIEHLLKIAFLSI